MCEANGLSLRHTYAYIRVDDSEDAAIPSSALSRKNTIKNFFFRPEDAVRVNFYQGVVSSKGSACTSKFWPVFDSSVRAGIVAECESSLRLEQKHKSAYTDLHESCEHESKEQLPLADVRARWSWLICLIELSW